VQKLRRLKENNAPQFLSIFKHSCIIKPAVKQSLQIQLLITHKIPVKPHLFVANYVFYSDMFRLR